MNIEEYCKDIKSKFPEVSQLSDQLYDDYWNYLVETEFSSYSWLESLAKAINRRMSHTNIHDDITEIFRITSNAYSIGDSELRKAIDVAFVENLFGQVSKENCSHFWRTLPSNLQHLYIGFHGRPPFGETI